ncbi:hypothetical protein LTR62_008713 [Meristemomyces frigidus]|uniref:Ribonuclease H n=1 Tax=Meristemomyces frigidus TaxID=1508187 RepID=A0AAN7T9P9_9PEZI|nr:hypothetical protein LTR62_008713 [Meristemomyces frigidus]
MAGFVSVNSPTEYGTVAAPAMTPPASTDCTKRKREMLPKFYAVRIGKAPGIYHTWADCLDQVRGFPKATFKSFTSLHEAQDFVEGEIDHTIGVGGGKSGSSTPQKWYGVHCGRVPGVYTSWQDVLDQIRGWKGPKHRGFKTRIEAELYVKEGNQSLVQYGVYMDGMIDSIETTEAPATKKSRKSGHVKTEHRSPETLLYEQGLYEPGEAPLNGAEDDFDMDITLDQTTGALRYKTGMESQRIKYQAVQPVERAPIRIYTDGSSLSNGQAGAIAGVGVFFGPADRRNISEGLVGTKQTNQRAELTAVFRALEIAPKDRKLIIISDSNYAIKCTTEWFQNWRRNGWLNSAKKPVENRDLVQKVLDNLEERYKMNSHRRFGQEDDTVEDDGKPPGPWERGPAGVKFVWVKGHSKDIGNEAADDLATAGAREARELVDGENDF